jgi:hypothetical protein
MLAVLTVLKRKQINVYMLESCYFCDEPHWELHGDYNGLFVCHDCRTYELPIDYDEQDTAICGVCFEEKTLLTLPCYHKLCLHCCKTIYFGIATTSKPMHWREVEEPNWTLSDEKYEEYEAFHTQWFNLDNSYEKLIQIRNNLLSIRPDWMNTISFIEYENEKLYYHCECVKAEKAWDDYTEHKFKGNGMCPFCETSRRKHCWNCFLEKLI